MPETYDTDKLQQGIMSLSHVKKPQGFSFEKAKARDEVMY